MKILYLGLPLGAQALRHAGHELCAVCIGHPDAAGMRRLRRSQRSLLLGRPDLDDAEVARLLLSTGYEVLLSWFWPRRVPVGLIERAKRGAFGCHPSLLPRWRGPDPYFHAIDAGDGTTGVTLHRLAAEYDTGRIVASIALPIEPSENAWRLARRLDRPSLALLVGCADALRSGLALEGAAQDESRATLAPAPDDDALALRVARPASALERRVRASFPLGASLDLDETPVSVLEARAVEAAELAALAPGEALVLGGRVVVRCGEGGLALDHIRIEPEERELRGLEIARLLPGISSGTA